MNSFCFTPLSCVHFTLPFSNQPPADLGYVWGHYRFKAQTKEGVDTTYNGAYATVYKKEADGTRKAVLDQDNDTPKP